VTESLHRRARGARKENPRILQQREPKERPQNTRRKKSPNTNPFIRADRGPLQSRASRSQERAAIKREDKPTGIPVKQYTFTFLRRLDNTSYCDIIIFLSLKGK
jgi:hypothetical protein